MADLPRHPESSDNADTPAADQSSSKRPSLRYVGGLAVAAILVLMIVLHLTGAVGPATH